MTLADLLRIVVFVSVAVIVGLATRWLASAVHGDLHVQPKRGARLGIVLLAVGMSSICASVVVTSLERYGEEGVSLRLLLAFVGSISVAAGLVLLRKVRVDGA